LRLLPIAVALTISLGLAACEETRYRGAARHNIPIPNEVMALMSEKGMNRANPVLIRSFKKESELEIWKMASDGQYKLLKSYPMCRWSGQLGPKKREGDRQAPEGFYSITPAHMNPNSAFYLSFNMGYPNNFDRAHGRTGAHLMVHGACSSSGCYSMSDDQIAEIYAIVREAHNGGQQAVQMQALPFRMTAENLARHRYDQHMPFWRNLKEGTDIFEVAKVAPKVSVCQARYAFNRTENCSDDPASSNLVAAATEKRRKDDAQVAALVASGTPAVRLVYQDGGQHQKFTQILMASGPDGLEQKAAWGSRSVGVSRPDAVLTGPQEIAVASTSRPATTAIAATPRVTAPAVAAATAEPAQVPVAATARPASAVVGASTSVARTAPAQPAAAAPATAAVATSPEQPSVLQRVMSFNPFAASAPEAPAAAQPEAKPAQTRAQQPNRPVPQASAANGVRVAQRPVPAAAEAD
jgi:murein L,D-transpeptidase YafK